MSDPSAADWAGHDPDVLGSLAIERNGLAWQRTALSWVAAGGAVARYFAGDGLLHPRAAVGYLMIAVAGLMWFDGSRRYRRDAGAIRADQPTAVPVGTIAAVWAVTSIVLGLVIVFEVKSW